MNCRKILLTMLLAPFAAPAFAGPAGAVFCKDGDARTLSAYDITLQPHQSHLIVYEARGPQGQRLMQLETYKVRGKLLEHSEKVARVRYFKPDGRQAQALISEGAGARIATVDYVDYHNYGMVGSFQRQGAVTIYYKDGPTLQHTFKDCTYEGGAIDDWNDLWAAPSTPAAPAP